MGNSGEFAEYVLENLAAIRGIEARRFFGGTGLFYAGQIFAMLMDNTLYFATDAATRERYVALGSHCFSYEAKSKGRVDITRYWAVPADLLEDPERLVPLAREAIGASGKTKTAARKASAQQASARKAAPTSAAPKAAKNVTSKPAKPSKSAAKPTAARAPPRAPRGAARRGSR